MSEQALKFDLKVTEIPVKIGDKDYTLREADARAAMEYRNAALKSFRMGQKGNPEQIVGDGIGGMEPLLVSLCLYEKRDDGSMGRVSEALIRSWPSRVVKSLFEEAKRISDLGEDDSIESLEEQIKDLTERLTELKEKEQTRKNSSEISTAG